VTIQALASAGGQAAELASILRRAPTVMRALRAAREVDAPDWLVGAGAIRNAVWDTLHRRTPAAPTDVDLVFRDPDDLTPTRDATVREALCRRAPLPWDASNQAAVHLWYPQRFGMCVPPLLSSAAGVATWPEIATCAGVRLLAGDDLLVVAPYGLDDLLNGVCRHNPALVPVETYELRVREKGFGARWPRLQLVSAADPDPAHRGGGGTTA